MSRRVLTAVLTMTALAALAHEQKQSVDQVMAGYIEAARPVREHDRLKTLAGSWKITTQLWMSPGKPLTGRGASTGRMVLGGRFLQMNATTKKPLPSESLTIFGFDRRTGEYTMTGFDTMGTYSISAAGRYNEPDQGVVLTGSYAMPPTGQNQKYRFVWKTPSPDQHVLSLYFALPDGKEMLVAETAFDRVN